MNLEERLKEINEALKILYKHDIDLALSDEANKELSQFAQHIDYIIEWL